jgi:hypothetical protein
MRTHLALALGTAALVAGATVPSHAAGAPVLDGKTVKRITGTASGGQQTHDADNADVLATPNRANCAMPRCYRLDFVYRPAKGVKGDVLFKITWTNPASDFDLYVSDDKKSDKAHCGGFGGTGEALVVSGRSFKPGKKYTLVADFFRSVNDTVQATVEFPTTAKTGTTVPAEAELAVPVNCVLDGR